MELPENTSMNMHAIDGKKPLYEPIYTLSLVKLETLKPYIKTHLKIEFIQLFKSLADIPILFNKKPDSSPCLYINYQGFNNLTIKN